jgi:hypothetical protein
MGRHDKGVGGTVPGEVFSASNAELGEVANIRQVIDRGIEQLPERADFRKVVGCRRW